MVLIAFLAEVDLKNFDETKEKTKKVQLCPESKLVASTFSADMKNNMPLTYKSVKNLTCDQAEETIPIAIMKIWRSGLDWV